MSFKYLTRKDDMLRRLKKIQISMQTKLDVEKLIEECSKMLLARKYRSFDNTVLTQASISLADWAGEIASHRARLADIRVMTLNNKMKLKKLLDATRNHLAVTYSDSFKAQQRVGDKKAIIDSALIKPINALDDFERLWAVTDIVQKELEDSSFSNTLIKNVLVEMNKSERI